MQLTTHLPMDAHELYFLAEGSLAHGTFEVSRTLPADSAQARVDVDVYYQRPDALSDITMCRIHHDDTWGLGIFVRSYYLLRHFESCLRVVHRLPNGDHLPTIISCVSKSTCTSLPIPNPGPHLSRWGGLRRSCPSLHITSTTLRTCISSTSGCRRTSRPSRLT